ncbi:MAG: EamA family transporter [Flavobacteriales bacterium]|nr:EamA family transporter [Flavobacteriales bacterium]
MNLSSKKFYHWALMILLAFIWGSSFILMKKGLIVFNDLEVAQLRMGIAWLSLLPFVWNKLFKIQKKHIIPILVVGLFGNGFPAFLFTKAQTELDSSLIGILNALVPLFTFVLAMLLFKTKVKVSQLIGILLGLSGAVWLIAGGGLVLENAHYSWYIIVATLCYAISLNTIKNYLQEMSAIDISGLAFFVVGPFCLLALGFSDFSFKMMNSEGANLALFYIIILSTVGTSIALVLFNQLVKGTTAIFASSVTYLIPIVAIFWGFIDGEIITLNHFIGIAIILGGIHLVNKA